MAKPQHSAYDREAKRLGNVANKVASVIDSPRKIDPWRQRRTYETVDPFIQNRNATSEMCSSLRTVRSRGQAVRLAAR